MKLISWNLNGIRAVAGKGLVDIINGMNADVICFQETKANPDQVREALFGLAGYEIYANIGEKPGYSGTAILSKTAPIKVWNGIGIADHDNQGRAMTAEFEKFFLVNTYVPNSGSELLRLPYRMTWDAALLIYFKELEKTKPVIWCGDMNVAHKPIDLKNDKANYNKSAGYMQEEIDGMNNFHEAELVDTFRHFYPEVEKYTWWSYRAGAREKNVGWRIDYFMVSKNFVSSVKDAFIMNEIHGSDHCPVGIDLN